jgi:hypothetical protein
VEFSTATIEDVLLTYRVISGTSLGVDPSKFPYRRAKNCLGEDGLVMVVTLEDFFTIVLLLLFEPSSVSEAVDVDIIVDALSTVDCNISPLFYTLMFLKFNFR